MKLQPNIRTLLNVFFLVICDLSTQSQTVTDYDGNVYQTVTIGVQIWMVENLKSIHYSNGETLILSSGSGEIEYTDTTKRFYYYNNDQNYADEFGCLYSWYAAVNGIDGSSTPGSVQGICPSGWHIPGLDEWEQLESYLGESAVDNMLEGGTSGFEALLAGLGGGDTPFQQMHESAFFLSSDPGEHYDVDRYCYITLALLRPDSSRILFGNHSKTCGYSVRCLKNEQSTSDISVKKDTKCILFPNPCKDYLYIDQGDREVRKLLLYSLDGRLVKSVELPGEKEISVRDIKHGFYIVKVFIGNTVFEDKLIIE